MAEETDGARSEAGDGPGFATELRTRLRTALVTGAAITMPILITVLVVVLVASVLTDLVRPFVLALSWLPVGPEDTRLLQIGTLVGLVAVMTAIGYVGAYWTGRSRLEDPVEEFVTALPGIGPIYETCDQLSELLVDADSHGFQEVVLVEYPTKGSYAVAFETAEPPEAIEAATGNEEMLTLFVPMAPNPVMGGFVLHVPPDRVEPVDLTVEEGIQSIVTSGVATGSRIHEQPAALTDGGDSQEHTEI